MADFGVSLPALSADALPATLYGHFTQARYRIRPINCCLALPSEPNPGARRLVLHKVALVQVKYLHQHLQLWVVLARALLGAGTARTRSAHHRVVYISQDMGVGKCIFPLLTFVEPQCASHGEH